MMPHFKNTNTSNPVEISNEEAGKLICKIRFPSYFDTTDPTVILNHNGLKIEFDEFESYQKIVLIKHCHDLITLMRVDDTSVTMLLKDELHLLPMLAVDFTLSSLLCLLTKRSGAMHKAYVVFILRYGNEKRLTIERSPFRNTNPNTFITAFKIIIDEIRTSHAKHGDNSDFNSDVIHNLIIIGLYEYINNPRNELMDAIVDLVCLDYVAFSDGTHTTFIIQLLKFHHMLRTLYPEILSALLSRVYAEDLRKLRIPVEKIHQVIFQKFFGHFVSTEDRQYILNITPTMFRDYKTFIITNGV